MSSNSVTKMLFKLSFTVDQCYKYNTENECVPKKILKLLLKICSVHNHDKLMLQYLHNLAFLNKTLFRFLDCFSCESKSAEFHLNYRRKCCGVSHLETDQE